MRVDLGFNEMWYLLESCLRGSHLRTSTIERFVDEFYHEFTDDEKCMLRYNALDKIYNWNFSPITSCCGKDVWFMERYDPDNRYKVTVSYNGKTEVFDAFKHKGKDEYYTGVATAIAPEYVIKVEKVEYEK